jgi:hypothetical protein
MVKLRKFIRGKTKSFNAEIKAEVDTSMTGAISEVFQFAASKRGW